MTFFETMNYGLLADSVVVIHFLWIVFLLFGAAAGVRYRAVRLLHGAALVFAIMIQMLGWYCPLTHLEQWLRMRHNPLQSYAGSFIGHYLEKIIYWEASRTVIFWATIVLIAANLCIYWKVTVRPGAVKRRKAK